MSWKTDAHPARKCGADLFRFKAQLCSLLILVSQQSPGLGALAGVVHYMVGGWIQMETGVMRSQMRLLPWRPRATCWQQSRMLDAPLSRANGWQSALVMHEAPVTHRIQKVSRAVFVRFSLGGQSFDWRLATIAGMEVAKLVPWNSLLN